MSEIVFYALSILAIFGALMVIFSRNAMYSVIYLIITFFAIAGHFVFLSATFLAIVNIIVYAGAIMVLFLYVVMLLNLNQQDEPFKRMVPKVAAAISAGALLLVMVAAVRGAEQLPPKLIGQDYRIIGTVQYIGKMLFTKYLLPFELTSILFLAAMVGAVMLGKREA